MKITHVVENLHRGGLERVVLDLVGEQSRAGHDCQVICLYGLGQLAPELASVGVPVHACEKRVGFDLAPVFRLRRLLRQHDSDVVHTHNLVCNYHAALALTGLRRRRMINTGHGMGPRIRRGRQKWFYQYSLPRTDLVVTVCKTAREQFLREGLVPREKLVTVPNGIPMGRDVPVSNTARQRLVAEFGLPQATRLIGSVARLNPIKDPATLVRAFVEVHQRMPDTALLLIGAGPLKQQLAELISAEHMQDHIRLAGDRSDVHALLAGLDLFAMASVSEGYSIALLEACAAGLPIVATDVGGNAEIVREGVNGRLAPAQDAHALAAAMCSVLGNADAARAMGQAGRDWIAEHGSLQAMAQRYEELYRPCR